MAQSAPLFTQALILLSAAVVTVPVFKRLGLGSVLGYLAAGIAVGPFGLNVFSDADAVLHFAEIGVVLLLFVIGLELKPSRLWSMRHDIFGLGLAQVLLSGLVLTALAHLAGLQPRTALVAGFGLALSSTAFALQILSERGETNSLHGQRAFSILLFQDLAIVPMLALVALLSPAEAAPSGRSAWIELAIITGALVSIVLAGRYLLNPLFRILAQSRAREIMTAAALLVVLGAAALMQVSGMSMAMGAFLAGVLLAESAFRHQLEADIEPFRGIMMGLFFIAVGMIIDLDLVLAELSTILIAVVILLVVKITATFLVARIFGNDVDDALRIGLLLPQAGEFGFVLFSAATVASVMVAREASVLAAIITLSMALTPATVALGQLLVRAPAKEEMEESFDGASGSILFIGFGRFGQIAAQMLLAEGVNVTIIDDDPQRIRSARKFGFRIFYGDGTSVQVLRSAGAENAQVIAICTRNKPVTNRIIELCRGAFPMARLYVRSYDRTHTLELLALDVDYQIRETFESGMVFGRALLEALGLDPERALEVDADVRHRDQMRLAIQQAEGIYGGMDMLHPTDLHAAPEPLKPEPLTRPRREAEALTEQTREIAEQEEEEEEQEEEEAAEKDTSKDAAE